ncbi:MAG: AmmeMemoRadiSam system protein B [Phycisphaerae bacterium]|nr:AmmeMemoRadiSam system protein B [Phycisphaerae bacterium]
MPPLRLPEEPEVGGTTLHSSMSTDPSGAAAPRLPKFDPGAPHQQKPKLRQVRGFGAQIEGRQALGLADARQVSDRVVFVPPAAQLIFPHMTGERSLEEIVSSVGHGLTREILEGLVAQLDDAGLLFGPVFDAMLVKMRSEFDSSAVLPPAATAAFTDAVLGQELGEKATEQERAEKAPGKLRELMDRWIEQALERAEDPAFDALPKVLIAPHLDYGRGAFNYAAAWGRTRVADRPDRVIILGTNHFGEGTGVVACDKGYQTALGVCEADADLVALLRASLGEALFKNRFDHEREHSIELQIPWIQHCLGAGESGRFPRVFAALVHDPAVNNGESYDGQGVALMPFVEAMRAALGKLGGRTLIVASADLSHVGPMFGDQVKSLAGEEQEATDYRNKVFQHDREMVELVRQNKPEELIAAMAWQQNPTRWCSTGNLTAAMLIAQPTDVKVLNYVAAMDEQGMGMVSSIAGAMF